MSKPRKPADDDHRPITPSKVEAWIEGLEKGHGRPGFLKQLVESHRELFAQVHGEENKKKKNQLSLF